MASTLRQLMSVPSRLNHERVVIKFESYEE